MKLELLARVVRGRVVPLVGTPEGEALARVPALADALPEVPVPVGDRPVVFPAAYGEVLAPLVERALRAALDEALVDLRPTPDDELARRFESDSLVRALRQAAEDALAVSDGAGVVVALELARQSCRALRSPPGFLADAVRRVGELPPVRQGAVLGRVADALRSRVGFVAVELARAGVRPPALFTALADARMVWVRPFDPVAPFDLAWGVGLGGVPVAESLLTGAIRAFDLVAAQVLARAQARSFLAADAPLALRFCLAELGPAGEALARLRAEPEAWALILPQLSRWVDAPALVAAGVPAADAAELLRVEVGIGLATVVGEALGAARRWEVHASLAAALGPAPEGSIEARLLVPRTRPVEATVVVLSLGMVSAAMAEPTALSREARELVAAWVSAAGSAAISEVSGAVATFVFGDPVAAVRFAVSAGARSPAGAPRPAVSVASGPVVGGTDGGTVRVAGAAVQDALAGLAQLPRVDRAPGLFGGAEVYTAVGRLRGHGVVVDDATLAAVAGRLPALGGDTPPDVRGVWELDGAVLVAAELEGAGLVQVARLSPADWSAVARGVLEPRPEPEPPPKKPVRSATIPTASPAPPPAPDAADASHEVRRPRRAGGAPSPFTPESEPTDHERGRAVAGNPFDTPAAEPVVAAPASSDPFSGDAFGDVFGVPVGDEPASEAAAPPPAFFDGAMGFEISEAEPPAAAEPEPGFALPAYEGDGAAPVAAAAPDRKPKRPPVVDFNFLLAGYACYVERDRVVFGRPYGTRLIDRHAFDTAGDLDRAYQAFMEAKIREGFIPQTEMVGELPRTVTVMPLDPERLASAWRALT